MVVVVVVVTSGSGSSSRGGGGVVVAVVTLLPVYSSLIFAVFSLRIFQRVKIFSSGVCHCFKRPLVTIVTLLEAGYSIKLPYT